MRTLVLDPIPLRQRSDDPNSPVIPAHWDYWAAVTDAPCPCGEGTIRWAEAGYVPGWRQCDSCGTHWRAKGSASAPRLEEQDYPRDRGPYGREET